MKQGTDYEDIKWNVFKQNGSVIKYIRENKMGKTSCI